MNRIISRIADFIRETDKVLLFLCFFASSYGCLAVFSATRHLETLRPVLVQMISLALGIAFAVIISSFDYERFIQSWYIFAVIGIIPVILTFFIGFAPEGTDDKAWLNLGITTFQPSELLKICFIISFSSHISKVKENINKLKYLIPVCLHGAFPVLLIHFQGDDGTALVFAIIVLCMLCAAGVSWKYFLAAGTAALIASPIVFFFIMNEDQRSRLINLFNIEGDIQGATFQAYYGRRALANGGFFGQGLLKGTLTKVGYVPEGQNDFIFVSIGEQLGFLGCMAVIILLCAIALRAIHIAKICRKQSGKLICIGFFSMLLAQVTINIGMCIGVLPVIGVTLPFFSAGGTSLLCLYLGVGLVMSVYMHRNSRTIYLHD